MQAILKAAIVVSCVASQYAPCVMDRVVRTRQTRRVSMPLPDVLPEVDGYVAVEDCSLIGEVVEIRPVGGAWETFLIADCSGHATTSSWMQRNNICVEVDYDTAVRWGTVGRGIEVEVQDVQERGYEAW